MSAAAHKPPIPIGTSRSGEGLISVLVIRHPDFSSPEGARHQISNLTGGLAAADLDVVGYTLGRGDAAREAPRIIRWAWGIEP